jgi:hypothetical protein
MTNLSMIFGSESTQLEDPRDVWKKQQESMLSSYLQTAQDDLEAKKEIRSVKQQRLLLAKEDLERAQHALKGFSQVGIWGNWRGYNTLSRAFHRLAFGGNGGGTTRSQGLYTGWHLGELYRA